MKIKIADATFAAAVILTVMLTIAIFLAIKGPAVAVKDFKVPQSSLVARPYNYWVPALPRISLQTILSCIAVRNFRAL